MLVLVALAALPVVSVTGPQDRTRYELTRHLVLRHTLTVEPTLFDRAVYNDRSYSDKAPGMSFLAVPAYELERAVGIARAPTNWRPEGDLSLWVIRVLTSGILFLVMVFLVGWLAEGFVAGTGAVTAATFGVATLASPLAPTLFEHDAAGALALAAFALVVRARRNAATALAGLCAGLAVLFQYSAVLVVAALLVVCARSGWRRLGTFALGGLPAVAALAAYDNAAFGSPFHLSYRYVANRFTERQHHGFFGIDVPTLTGVRDVVVGPRGLLLVSPVSVFAAVGLWWMWRRGQRIEAAVCAALVFAFVLVDAGYFLPYGGRSPGPRFLACALPFLALGLPFAFARLRNTTLAVAAVSAVLTVADSVTWAVRSENPHRWLPTRNDLAKTVWSWLGANRDAGAAIIVVCALASLAIGGIGLRRETT